MISYLYCDQQMTTNLTLSFSAICDFYHQVLAHSESNWWHLWWSELSLYLSTHGNVLWISICRRTSPAQGESQDSHAITSSVLWESYWELTLKKDNCWWIRFCTLNRTYHKRLSLATPKYFYIGKNIESREGFGYV